MADASDTSNTADGVEPSISVEFVDDNNPDNLSVINFTSGRKLVKGTKPILLTEAEVQIAAEAGVELNIDRSKHSEPVPAPAPKEIPWAPSQPPVAVSGGISPEVPHSPSPGQ